MVRLDWLRVGMRYGFGCAKGYGKIKAVGHLTEPLETYCAVRLLRCAVLAPRLASQAHGRSAARIGHQTLRM